MFKLLEYTLKADRHVKCPGHLEIENSGVTSPALKDMETKY